jgi:hypothetical protein
MASWTSLLSASTLRDEEHSEPNWPEILAAMGLALAFVVATRWPVARAIPIETDEFGFMEEVAVRWFPMHHTLFKTMARVAGLFTEDPYRGFIVLDLITSALALVSAWWWLRAIVKPATAAAAALVLGVGPIFWGYGAIAGNYTMIVVVGSFLLGVAVRGHRRPESWHPFAAAAALAVGAGYRSDVGMFWLPVFLVILWQHRWKRAVLAGVTCGALNLALLGAIILECGGWARYRAATADFAHSAGLLNSYWNLGFVDGPLRYMVKLGMALIGTLGPALLFVPRGAARLRRNEMGGFLAFVLSLSVAPALSYHLLVHFGLPGYSFHHLPALVALAALGIGRETVPAFGAAPVHSGSGAVPRLLGVAAILAAVFLFYPTDFSNPGWRGDFDLAFCRLTRKGIDAPTPKPAPLIWRTANSVKFVGRE